jgi:putative protease
MEEKKIGMIMDFFAKVGVAAFRVEGDTLKVGDTIHIKGHTTDLTQEVTSLQIDRAAVQEAKSGDDVGIKVKDRVRKGDMVFKVVG